MAETIVITGFGMVSPYGAGNRAFRERWNKKESAVGVLSRFNEPSYRHNLAAEIPDFDAGKILGLKKLRLYDRATLLSLCAAETLLQELGVLDENRRNKYYPAEEIGIVVGTYGSIKTTITFDMEVAREPQHVQPSTFPNTIMNAAASYIAIRYDCRALSTTISNGDTSSLEGIGAANTLIHSGHGSFFMVGGVEELTEHFALLKQRKTDHHKVESPILGEGACLVSLEKQSRVQERNGKVLADLVGFRNCFCPDPDGGLDHNLKELEKELGSGLYDQLVHVFPSERQRFDEKRHFRQGTQFHTLRDKVGYLCSAIGAIQVAAALVSEDIPSGSLVLCNNIGLSGNCATLILRKR